MARKPPPKKKYQDSLNVLLSINKAEPELRVSLDRLNTFLNKCLEDVALELNSPKQLDVDKAFIAALTATIIYLNEQNIETGPLRQLSGQLLSRSLRRSGPFAFEKNFRKDAKTFEEDKKRACVIAFYETYPERRNIVYKFAKSHLNLNKGQVQNLSANFRHDKISDIIFKNLYQSYLKTVSDPEFDFYLYFSDT